MAGRHRCVGATKSLGITAGAGSVRPRQERPGRGSYHRGVLSRRRITVALIALIAVVLGSWVVAEVFGVG